MHRSIMRVHALRTLLLGVIFIIVIMAIYFNLIPSAYFQHTKHGNKNRTYLLINSGQGFSSSAPTPRPSLASNGTALHSKASNTKTLAPKAPVQIAMDMFHQRGVVFFTMINDAYFDFAASWCCNTAHLRDVHQRTLFLTTDDRTGQRLRAGWPNVTVVSLNTPELAGVQEYSKAGYIRLMVERTKFILHLLEAGVQLLLFEVDCLWLTDPTPVLVSRQSEGDILATRVTGQTITAGGFLLLNPTQPTVKLWQKLTHMMEDLLVKLKTSKASASVSEDLNDQQFFSTLLKQKYAGIKVVHLPADLFPDGKWYAASPEKRSSKPRPLIINNNWVTGNAAKIQRARAFGHWFWNQAEKSCNTTAIQNLFH